MVKRQRILAEAVPNLLTPGEVAAIFGVDPKTVTRWATSGKLPSLRTPGGHRRFDEEVVRDFLKTSSNGSVPEEAE